MAQEKENREQHNPLAVSASTVYAGLNTDATSHQYPASYTTYALNAVLDSHDGNQYTYQTEAGNEYSFSLPEGYIVIGAHAIVALDWALFFLVHESDGSSEIGYYDQVAGVYNTTINDASGTDKLNFSLDNPIQEIVLKKTNCDTQVYFTDGLNPRRYLDFGDLPWQEIPDPDNEYKKIKVPGVLDTNKMLVQPVFSIPEITLLEERTGGQLTEGVYQFCIQYGNAHGQAYTSCYGITNNFPIWKDSVTAFTDEQTSKAISLFISGLDVSGVYDYFNLIVIKTINSVSTAYVAATLPTTKDDVYFLYTGENKTEKRIDISEVLMQFPYYDTAEGVFETDGVLGWYTMKSAPQINELQRIANKVKVYWQTWQIPYNNSEGYKNAQNAALLKGYFRNEVYALEIGFLLDNGQQLPFCHIPGREALEGDRDIVTSADAMNDTGDPCADETEKERWQVYNTATVIATEPGYVNDNCYKGPYQYGEMAYFESEERYPVNASIWGSLSGQPIRHHKMPDSFVTHIHDNATETETGIVKDFEHKIYPLGIKIDADSVYQAIADANLPESFKRRIVGFKIARANRKGHESVVARGILHNMGSVEHEGNVYHFPNYPYNDLRPDPYFANQKFYRTKDNQVLGYQPDKMINGFADASPKSRFTFHSPDTHFFSPSLSNDGSYLTMDAIIYGSSWGHFVKVRDNAEYKILTPKTILAAAGIGRAAGLKIAEGMYGWPTFTVSAVIPGFQAASDLFEKLAPYYNYGRSFHSIGQYGRARPVENIGFKNRLITYNKYITPGMHGGESGIQINNYQRESSVYISTNGTFGYTHEYDPEIPEDNSRYVVGSEIDTPSIGSDFDAEYISTNSYIVTDEFIIERAAWAASRSSGPTNVFKSVDTASVSFIPAVGDTYTDTGGSTYKIVTSHLEDADGGNYSGNIFLEHISGTAWLNSSGGTLTSGGNTITYQSYSSLTANQLLIECPELGPGLLRPKLIGMSDIEYKIPPANFTGTTVDDYWEFAARWTAYMAMAFYMDKSVDENAEYGIRQKNISSYYGTIHRFMPAQYGRMYSYETIDTGYYQSLKNEDGNDFAAFKTVFGGDCFINKFSYKTKIPIFRNNTVKDPNGTDIAYDEEGNLTYPMFWLSTKSIETDIDLEPQMQKMLNGLENNFLQMIANLFTGGAVGSVKVMNFLIKLFREVYEKLGIKNVNLDLQRVNGITEQGIMYLFVYGLPTFFCESTVNVDYRDAHNETDGDFYPRSSSGIPDDWLQEVNVSIQKDNTYYYNQTYSKQIKEYFFNHLREDYDPEKECLFDFPNRSIYSDKSNMEETRNNWLIYRPTSYFDFPKADGKLTAINKIANDVLLVRFDTRSRLYNAMATIDTNTPYGAQLGNPGMFASRPIDLSLSDTGDAGSQHKLFLNTPYGAVYVDAKRGQVLLVNGNQVTDIALKGNERWFKKHLPFKALELLPDWDVDNNYAGIGLTGVYDAENKRLILTKLDIDIDENGNVCPPGYTYQDGSCVRYEESEPLFIESYEVAPRKNPEYGSWGTFVYDSFNLNGTGVCDWIDPTNGFWRNISGETDTTNRIGIWAIGNGSFPVGSWVGFKTCIDVPEAKTYYVALAGDDFFRLTVNGDVKVNTAHPEPPSTNLSETISGSYFITNQHSAVVSLDPSIPAPDASLHKGTYRALNIYPISLSAGMNEIGLHAYNAAAGGLFGAEIYDNTKSEIMAATSVADLNIIFTTEGKTAFTSSEYICPAGFEPASNEQCLPKCVKNEVIPASYKFIGWTISFSFKTNSWVGWHSYIPLFYLGFAKMFSTGERGSGTQSVWNHNTQIKKYGNFYGRESIYEIEYPSNYPGREDRVFQSTSDYTTAEEVVAHGVTVPTDDYYDEVIVYNEHQSSGIRKLVKRDKANLSSYRQYPKFNTADIEILYEKTDSTYNINQLWDISIDKSQPNWKEGVWDKEINQANMNYLNNGFSRPPLRAKNIKLRFTSRNENIRITTRFIIIQSHESIK